jgi:hypothetical protein
MNGQVTRKWITNDSVDGTKIRLNNNEFIRFRNAANSGDVNLIKGSAADQGELGVVTLYPFVPSLPTELANVQYVLDIAAGMRDPKDAVRLLQDSDIALTGGAALSVDSVPAANGDRILLIGQALPEENGIYVVSGIGVAYVLTRSSDADTDAEVTNGLSTWVTDGILYVRTGWLLTTPDPISLDVTPLTFVEIPISATTAWNRQQFALTAPQIAGGVTLANAPVVQSVRLIIEGAGNFFYGTDYSVAGTLLTFSAGLQALLVAGDNIEVQYQY